MADEKTPDIKFIEPEQLLIIEAYFMGTWVAVTFNQGTRLCTTTIESAKTIITQLNQVHIAKARKAPPFRYRPMSKEETEEVRRLTKKHGDGDGKFGSDIRNRKKPNLGEHQIIE